MENIILINGVILTPLEVINNSVIFVRNGTIEKIIKKTELDIYGADYLKEYKLIDAGGNYISPGFIDIHTHGANDADAVKDCVLPMCEFMVKHGTTGFLPTLWTAEFGRMIESCKRISLLMESSYCGSKILGINSEGPYLNPDFGAQKRELVKTPRFEDYSRLVEAGNGRIKVMTVAPELENSKELVKYLRQNNIVVSIGHTNVSMEKMDDAIDWGFTLTTHILNAFGDSVQPERGVKAVGIQEALLIRDDLMSEILCDKNGIHVNPTVINIVLRCKGVERIVLITDSMNMTGFPPGKYALQDGRMVDIAKGADIVRLENDDLAGSVMTMNKTIINFINHTGIALKDAVRMATYNPAAAIGVSSRKGELRAGMDADIAVFDDDIEVKLAMVEGKIEYLNL